MGHARVATLPDAGAELADARLISTTSSTKDAQNGLPLSAVRAKVSATEPNAAAHKEPHGSAHEAVAKPRDPFGYRGDIDGLRALAVAAVVIYHCDEAWMPGGFTGVDVFFVISGYVVAGSLLRPRKSSLSLRGYLLAFYARRVKRLTPSLVVVTCITALLMAFIIPPRTKELESFFLSGMLGMVGWANNYFAAGGGVGEDGAADYFGEVEEGYGLHHNPFTHYWSLGVEEQFYFIFPLILLFAYGQQSMGVSTTLGCVPSRPACGLGGRPLSFLVIGILISVVISCALSMTRKELAFYIVPSRFWQLSSGALLFDMQAFGGARWVSLLARPAIVYALELAALVMLALAFALTDETRLFPFPWSLLSVVGTLCFIAAGATSRAPGALSFNRLMSQEPFVYIGKLSYPLYLWHWPLLVLLKWLGAWDRDAGALRLVAVAISCVLAAFNYHAVEGFFRRWRPKKLWHVFAALLPLLGLAELWLWLLQTPLHGKLCLRDCGAAVEVLEPCKAQLDPSNTFALAGLGHGCACMRDPSNGQDHVPPTAVIGASGVVLSGGQNASLPPCYDPAAADLDLASSIEAGCWSEEDVSAKAKTLACLQRGACGANGTALPVLFLMGDSHVVNWEAAFSLAVQGSMTVSMYSNVCGLSGDVVYDAQLAVEEGRGACNQRRTNIMGALGPELQEASSCMAPCQLACTQHRRRARRATLSRSPSPHTSLAGSDRDGASWDARGAPHMSRCRA
jgi:peptidoglycan/LPS O-acetylase OafA/YrhL